tara:strand:+ start:161 stop:496 length:336 start_codon:yes stop_codon:yes gene_type:complete
MKNLYKILLVLVTPLILFSFTNETIISSTDKNYDKIEVNTVGDILCIENNGYSRHSFILWYKNEAISKMSVAGGEKSCFEIGDYEYSYQWKASKGIDGLKKGFYSNTATFY